jgi:acyl carrier protein
MRTLDDIASSNLARLLDGPGGTTQPIDLDADLFDRYGLTSLKMMLLITSVCDEAGGDLSQFSEDDVADMRTLRAIVNRLQPAAGAAERDGSGR